MFVLRNSNHAFSAHFTLYWSFRCYFLLFEVWNLLGLLRTWTYFQLWILILLNISRFQNRWFTIAFISPVSIHLQWAIFSHFELMFLLLLLHALQMTLLIKLFYIKGIIGRWVVIVRLPTLLYSWFLYEMVLVGGGN